jgi:hypothetical protein
LFSYCGVMPLCTFCEIFFLFVSCGFPSSLIL